MNNRRDYNTNNEKEGVNKMNELLTVTEAIKYNNMAERSAEALAHSSDDGDSISIDRRTVAEASACLMKFKSILEHASVVLN